MSMSAKPAANVSHVAGDKDMRGNEILLGKVAVTFQWQLKLEALSQLSCMVLGDERREQMNTIKTTATWVGGQLGKNTSHASPPGIFLSGGQLECILLK